jgi:hypothetical protein
MNMRIALIKDTINMKRGAGGEGAILNIEFSVSEFVA